MSTNLNDSTPAAPAGGINVKWQTDGSGNDSAYLAAGSNPSLTASVNLLTQAANIAATTLLAVTATGLYRVSAYIIRTQVATTSSTLPSVVITWTDADNSAGQTFTLTPTNATNTLVTPQQASMVVDALTATNIRYATTGYASVGGTPMQYALHLRLEKV